MKQILYIGNRLSGHGINRTSIETLGPLLQRSGFALYYASSQKNKLFRLIEMAWKTMALSRKLDFVLIDTYSTSNFWFAVIVSQLCRLIKKPYIPILHGGNLPKRLAQSPTVSAMLFNHAFVNVAPSGYLLDAFNAAGFVNVKLIPNAILLADYPFKTRRTLKPNLLWVRAFADIYNPQMAVKVLELLKKNYPEATLHMIGPAKDNSLEATRRLAQELHLSVSFSGKLSKAEWIEKAQNSDFFINTTHFDNMPVSIIEAMALGLPVISTDVGGIPYLIERSKTGMLVGDNDAESMVRAIVKLLSNNEFASQIIENAHQSIQNFDESKVAAKWVEILQ